MNSVKMTGMLGTTKKSTTRKRTVLTIQIWDNCEGIVDTVFDVPSNDMKTACEMVARAQGYHIVTWVRNQLYAFNLSVYKDWCGGDWKKQLRKEVDDIKTNPEIEWIIGGLFSLYKTENHVTKFTDCKPDEKTILLTEEFNQHIARRKPKDDKASASE